MASPFITIQSYNADIGQNFPPQRTHNNNSDNTIQQMEIDQMIFNSVDTNENYTIGLTYLINDVEIDLLNPIKDKVNLLLSPYNQQIDYKNVFAHLNSEINKFVERYDLLQRSVLDELKKWQRTQLMGFDDENINYLDDIQTCFEGLVNLIKTSRAEILRLLYSQTLMWEDTTILQVHFLKITELYKNLIKLALIVEVQPGPVIKCKTKFTGTVRLLIGKYFGILKANPEVECFILSDAQVKDYQDSETYQGKCPAVIQNNSSIMKLEIPTNGSPVEFKYRAEFKDMHINNIQRTERRGSESVMDEKFAILFISQTTLENEIIQSWTFSAPIVVIVHANQLPHSIATIKWDNSFAEVNRVPFKVPEKVPWTALSTMLTSIMKKRTKRILDNNQLNFLRGVSIVWINANEVTHVQPFLMADLKYQNLANRLRNLNHLKYLYPDINKDDAFREFYTSEKVLHGYERACILETANPCSSNEDLKGSSNPGPSNRQSM